MIDFLQNIFFSLRDAFHGTYTLRILLNFFELVRLIAPYFFAAVLIQVISERAVRKNKVNLNFQNEHVSILGAALLGVLSPMPTYAAVPIALTFVRSGLAFSAAMTFMIASPLINPSVFFLTATLLGLKIALMRLVASILIALVGGYLIKLFKPAWLPI